MSDISLELAKRLVNSHDKFPVNFNQLWQWCSCDNRDVAKERLVSNFSGGIDYVMGEPIFVTVKCAKKFAILVDTEQGQEVQQYFLQAEESKLSPEMIDMLHIYSVGSTIC